MPYRLNRCKYFLYCGRKREGRVKVCQIVIEVVEFRKYFKKVIVFDKQFSQHLTQDICQTRQKYIELKCHWYDIIDEVGEPDS